MTAATGLGAVKESRYFSSGLEKSLRKFLVEPNKFENLTE